MGLKQSDKIDLLKMEYEKLTSEQRMYIEQYAPTLNIFGVTVLAGFAAALANTDYQAIYLFIPFVLFMIVHIGIGQAYMVAALGLRIRAIEETLKEMNAGEAILEWEHCYAPILVFSPWIRLPPRQGSSAKGFLNPTFLTVIFMVLFGSILIIGCSLKAFLYINAGLGLNSCWAWSYVAVITLFTLGAIVQSFSFFRIGYYTPHVDIRATST